MNPHPAARILAVVPFCVALATAVVAQSESPGKTVPTGPALSKQEISSLFSEVALLGKEKVAVEEQIRPLMTSLESFISVNGGFVDAEVARAKGVHDAAMAACDGKDWSKFRSCPGVKQQDQISQDQAAEAVKGYNTELRRRQGELTERIARRVAISHRLGKIAQQLAAQAAFSGACLGRDTLEAQVQCMQVQWDGASDQTSYVDSGLPNAAAPNSVGSHRTPEQAIRDYEASGRPRPTLKPSGKPKEPPPPPGK